ncbi:MAG TPA: hypothetical protein VK668_23340 [Mucilaginibacter sp.]|nr:hypothetical protein [Mucilaginibacter sp.]
MVTIYIALKIGALLLAMLLPVVGPRKRKSGKLIELSDWAVNEKGELIDLTNIEPDHHPIK